MRTCRSTRTGLHPVSHASPATRGARTSIEEGPPGVSLRGRRRPQGRTGLTFARVRSVCAHPMSFEPAQKAPFEGAPVSAGGVWVSSPDVGERRVARCGTSGAQSLPSRRRERAAPKGATTSGNARRAVPCGGRGSSSQKCVRASYLKTRCRSRKASSGSKKRPASIRRRDVNGGLGSAATIALKKRGGIEPNPKGRSARSHGGKTA